MSDTDIQLRLKKFIDDDQCFVSADKTFYQVPFIDVHDAMQEIEVLRAETAGTLGTMYRERSAEYAVLKADHEALRAEYEVLRAECAALRAVINEAFDIYTSDVADEDVSRLVWEKLGEAVTE